ncbi:hypothetical protein, partial [Mesorhizobium sp. M2D.F.Ca.ET.223.01.1.1]|uniref:hypothetical protein n=1 Tax=Mesorhizobium sp. M2D.F.Ca.ET.223.01.1.1 TaxID=2563940 RepID=UPI001AEDC961
MKELARIGAIRVPSFHQYLPRKGRETVHSGLVRKLQARAIGPKGCPWASRQRRPENLKDLSDGKYRSCRSGSAFVDLG